MGDKKLWLKRGAVRVAIYLKKRSSMAMITIRMVEETKDEVAVRPTKASNKVEG